MHLHCLKNPHVRLLLTCCTLWLSASACGDSDHEVEADALGVGAACSVDADCMQGEPDAGEYQHCLTQFKGGYCGIADCTASDECPEGSACVRHDDGHNYCFRICLDKAECNLHRGVEEESNCSSNVDYVDADKSEIGKACVPPSGG